jgi:hypothetical protein
MGDFAGSFGDKRRSVVLARLEQAMVAQSSVVVRRLGEDRAGEISAHRVLSAAAVTAAGIVECVARRTASAVAGRRIVVAQDTTEANFPGRRRKTLGPAGRTGVTPGFFIHAAVAIDAADEAVLGLVEAAIWTRDRRAVTDRAVRIIQLVDARDGSNRPAGDVASDAEIAAAALCPTLEGKTGRQRNPHPKDSLAWLSWIVARLGGWNCYYKPPGPKTMRQGWDRFAKHPAKSVNPVARWGRGAN